MMPHQAFQNRSGWYMACLKSGMQQLQNNLLYRPASSASQEGAPSSYKSAGMRLALA
jgi:hypothetical protein